MQSAPQYSPDSTLTAAQHHVLSVVAEGASITTAAVAAGVHRNTVANWRRTDPSFAREFEFAGRERSLFWHEQAAGLAPKAIEVLNTILSDETAAPSLRLRAALKVIAMAADPKPEPMEPFPASAAQLEAVDGRVLQLQSQNADTNVDIAALARKVHNPAQSCTIQPIRCPAEPGRTPSAPAAPASNTSAAAPPNRQQVKRTIPQAWP